MAFLLKIMPPEEVRWPGGSGGYFRLAWFDTEDGEWGGVIGDDDIADGAEPQEREMWETWAATRAARDMRPVECFHGFCWENRPAAQKALAAAKLAMKGDRPLPEWAQTALAEGWKAPKGWKP